MRIGPPPFSTIFIKVIKTQIYTILHTYANKRRFFRYGKVRQYGVPNHLDDFVQQSVQNNCSVNYVHSFSFSTFVPSNLDIL